MAGPDGIYVVNHLAKQVVVLGWDGRFRYAFGADATSEHGCIAVSRENLVFVSDNFEHIIKVYRIQKTGNITSDLADALGQPSRMASSSIKGLRAKGEAVRLMARIGGVGVAPGSFNGIAGLSVADDFLFVADNLNARVQIMMINPNIGKRE